MIRLSRLALLLALVPATAATAAAAPAPLPAVGPPLATPKATLDSAMTCRGRLAHAKRDPVLLVPGTFADSDINWSWNYQKVLPRQGRAACTVDLPGRSAGDIQVSTEYVVNAIRTLAQQSGRKVAVMGHSQGGLEIRWALRWWPDIRKLVSDVVMLATPNQGSAFPDAMCGAPGACAASLYQMRTGSAFLTALNQGGETVGGVPYTAIVTNDDKAFVLASQGVLHGSRKQVSNIAVQAICPGHVVNHQALAFDGPAYAIVMDALTHPGPAVARRIGRGACARAAMPGVSLAYANKRLNGYLGTLAGLLGPNGPKAQGEPPLAAYVG